jgi:TetR/AcrR family transcriptional repressor of mexJK operon
MTELIEADVALSPRSQVKRQQIIEAAQRLFLRDGFARTSMDAIRDQARVSKPTLYTHFDNKENLFVGIIEHSLDDISSIWDHIATSIPSITSKAQLRKILHQFAKAGISHLLAARTVKLARTVLAEGSIFPDLGRKFRDRVPQRASRMIAAVLTHAYEQNLLRVRKNQIPTAVRCFQAQLLSYLLLDGLLVFDQPINAPTDQDLEMMVDLFIEMIC